MKKLRTAWLFIVLVMGISAVHAETVTRSVPLTSEITRVYLYGDRQLYLTQGDEEFVRLTAPEDMVSEIEARLRGKSLYLGNEVNFWEDEPARREAQAASVRFDVQLKRIDAVRVLGSGQAHISDLKAGRLKIILAGNGKLEARTIRADDVRVEMAGNCDFAGVSIESGKTSLEIAGSANVRIGQIESDEVEIDIAGSGDVNIEKINAVELETEISGSADLELAGRVGYQDLEVNGSADYSARKLISKETYVEIRGSGDVEISVQQKLTAELSRGADLVYYGGPDLDVDISGRGKSRHAGSIRRNE